MVLKSDNSASRGPFRPGDVAMKAGARETFDGLFARRPELECMRKDVFAAFGVLASAYEKGRKVLVCGNGGSAADAEHIVGELLNKFKRHRPLPPELAAKLPPRLASRLEYPLAAISLSSMTGVLTAAANDISWDLAFAQQALGLADEGDVLIAISTSGKSANCIAAAEVARAKGAAVVAFTGAAPSPLAEVADVTLAVPETETFKVQELHIAIYHAICAALEAELR